MDLASVLDWLNRSGFPFKWRTEPLSANTQALLRPPNGQTLELGGVEVAIVIPDVHLGAGNDVFSGVNGPSRSQRLSRFLTALATLRDELGEDRFRVVQLGDWYDFYRAPLPDLNLQVHAIEAQYVDIFNAARALPVLHCIGNHDAALYRNPGATQSRFGIAQPLGTGSSIMAYHGHDNRTLEAIQEQDLGASILLNICDLVALVPLLGSLVDYIERIADDSFEEPWTLGNGGGDEPWPKAAGGADAGVPGWTAPWVARDASALVRVARGVEYATQSPVQLVFVGHSHRPGISSSQISGARQIALVDVGSWTYGRAEIAIVTPDGVGLAAMPVA